MKKLVLTFAFLFISTGANAALVNCFEVGVKGMDNIQMMMTALNKYKNLVYKVISDGDSRNREAMFYIKMAGDKTARNLYEKIVDIDGKFQTYVEITSASFNTDSESCKLFESVNSEI